MVVFFLVFHGKRSTTHSHKQTTGHRGSKKTHPYHEAGFYSLQAGDRCGVGAYQGFEDYLGGRKRETKGNQIMFPLLLLVLW